jgi:hypothetical protein
MKISPLDELKTKVAHVIVMILLVKMFERSKMVTISTDMDLLSYSVCISYHLLLCTSFIICTDLIRDFRYLIEEKCNISFMPWSGCSCSKSSLINFWKHLPDDK